MTKEQIAKAAEQLAKAWRENHPIERLSNDLIPSNRETAVAIQDELAKRIGHKVVGCRVKTTIPEFLSAFTVIAYNAWRFGRCRNFWTVTVASQVH